jgi:Protein of unknown function (DUF1353)
MTEPQDLARAVAADLEPAIRTELEREIKGEPPPGGGTRAVGFNEIAAVASFLYAAANVVLEVWRARRDNAELVAELADGLEIDPRLAAHLDPEKRLGLMAGLLNKLLPDVFGRSPATRAAGLAEKRRWVDSYIGARRGASSDREFLGGPTILVPFADQDNWIVYAPIGWIPDASDGTDVVRVDVPKGFVTDLASVPSYLWVVLNKLGKYGNAAIYHDWLYWQQTTTRAVADRVFDRAMHDMGVDAVTRKLIWAGVRIFGGSDWDDNAAAKASGERRVLKLFPDSPTITWEEWRKRDVFA